MVEVQISYSSCFLNEDGLVLLMDKESQLMFKNTRVEKTEYTYLT